MNLHWRSWFALVASCTAAPLYGSCARQFALAPLALPAPVSVDDSALCEGLSDRFIGLPQALSADAGPASATPPLAGRWWIRSCSAKPASGELRVRLEGPGWYWVSESRNGLSVRQQVPFNLSLELDGKVRVSSAAGVFSIWLELAREPRVEVVPAAKLAVQSNGAWGSVLSAVLPVQAIATQRFSESAAAALRDGLRGGATFTYEIESGQSDAALGKLTDGQTPRHPFQDGSAWLINERLLLAPGATHALGPLEPGTSILDVTIERGPGLTYRALCVEDMERQYPAIASGRAEAIADSALVAEGSVAGAGAHEITLRVEGCKHYLVLSAHKSTLAALRVRA